MNKKIVNSLLRHIMSSPLGFIGIGTINAAVANGVSQPFPLVHILFIPALQLLRACGPCHLFISHSHSLSLSHTLAHPPQLCSCERAGGAAPKITISPRNAAKAAALATAWPAEITMAGSNQEVVDAADVVFIATPPGPENTRANLEPLTFRADQTIICLISGVSPELLAELCAPVAPSSIVQAFPLPPAQYQASTTVCTPPNAIAEEILSRVGKVIPVPDFASAMKIGAISCVMGDFYAHLRACHEWLITNGIEESTASEAVGAFFNTFNHASRDSATGFGHLVAEQTPGGMNEQVIAQLKAAGNYTNLKTALDMLLPRLLG